MSTAFFIVLVGFIVYVSSTMISNETNALPDPLMPLTPLVEANPVIAEPNEPITDCGESGCAQIANDEVTTTPAPSTLINPTEDPTQIPTNLPTTKTPTNAPMLTENPTQSPTSFPTTETPTNAPVLTETTAVPTIQILPMTTSIVAVDGSISLSPTAMPTPPILNVMNESFSLISVPTNAQAGAAASSSNGDCAAHPVCAQMGLSGDCCPNPDGQTLGCCDDTLQRTDAPTLHPVRIQSPTSEPTATPTTQPIGHGHSTNVTSTSCADHSACSHFYGDCCPSAEGVMLWCCDIDLLDTSQAAETPGTAAAQPMTEAACSLHNGCTGITGDCCPNAQGHYLWCCGAQSKAENYCHVFLIATLLGFVLNL